LDTHTNALAETALALAMAFFSIMVLAFVSMGAGRSTVTTTVVVDQPLALVDSVTSPADTLTGEKTGATVSTDALVLHHQGLFYSGNLTPVSEEQLRQMAHQPDGIVVAVAPDLTLSEVLRIRKMVSGENVTITTQTSAWITALKETSK